MEISNSVKSMWAGVSALALAIAAAPTAAAQQTDAAADADRDQTIVVTGTRIRRNTTFNFPVPLAAVGEEQIIQSGSAQLGDVVGELPAINQNNNLQNTSGTLFNTGQHRADLRGLGSVRTLVLVDGRRHIFTDARSPGVDLNMIPSMMVERIEAISGGASAVYGSDAISGVVNVVLRDRLQGGVADLQFGVSEEGDGQEQRYSAAWGEEFLGGRLSLVAGVEYSEVDNIMLVDRAEEGLFPGIRRSNLVTPNTIIPMSRSITGPVGTWVLSSTRSANIDPVTRAVNLLTDRNCFTAAPTALCNDPALRYSQEYNELQGAAERGTARALVTYEINPEWSAFAELGFGQVNGHGNFQPAFSNTSAMPIVFRGDNAFLAGSSAASTALRSLWLATPGRTLTQASTANVIKFWPEFGLRSSITERTLYRGVMGLEGEFGFLGRNWEFDGYYQFGEVRSDLININVPWVSRVQQAVDAVSLGGVIQCRVNTNGCVPLDIINGPSQEAIDWVNRSAYATGLTRQHVASASVAGDVIELPAGPLGLALGLEYRHESNKFGQDALSASDALFFNALGSLGGEYDIREGFIEARIPILADMMLAEELSVEVALRRSDYSTFGEQDAERYVLSYRPIEDIWFRASRGTSVRGPNVVELYAPQGQNFGAVRDACDPTSTVPPGADLDDVIANCSAAIPGYNRASFVSNIRTQTARLRTGGNPDLGPETADTTTIGVVLEPRFLPDLNASFDFWKIELTNGVGTVPAQTAMNLCYGDPGGNLSNPSCAAIIRDPSGAATGTVGGVIDILGTNLNLASFELEGWDAAIEYSFDLADLLKEEREMGRLTLRADVTRAYLWEQVTVPGQPVLDLTNAMSNATPEWKGTTSVSYNVGPVTLGWTMLYVGSQRISNTLSPATSNPYNTGDYYRHDVRVNWRLSEDLSVRAGILNLADEYPPPLPESFTGSSTGASIYDNRGRFAFIGTNVRF